VSSQLKYYYKNREVCILRNRQYYAEQMNAGNEEILLEDECEVCAQGGADHFWRNAAGGGRNTRRWMVLHKSCGQQLKEEGTLPPRSYIRHKSTLLKKRGSKS
jgi:hypothetical protein